jgi:hypothetical protein
VDAATTLFFPKFGWAAMLLFESNLESHVMSIRLRVAGIFFDDTINFDLVTKEIGMLRLPGRSEPTLDLLGNALDPKKKNPTILDLMEAMRVKHAPTNPFNYVFERRLKRNGRDAAHNELPAGPEDVLSMVSISNTLIDEIKNSLGGNRRGKGKYQLSETLIPNGVVAWQSYVLRGGIPVSSLVGTNPSPPTNSILGKGFTAFDQSVLEDGDTVIWRMVAIRRVPD